jgi:hypothetical protein
MTAGFMTTPDVRPSGTAYPPAAEKRNEVDA